MAEDNTSSSLSTSITDLMTSIAVIFILLLVVYINHSFQEVQKGSASRREKVLKGLTLSNIKAKNDKNDPLAIVFAVNGDELQFDINKYNIKSKGQIYLRQFTPKLIKSICSPDSVKDIESVNIIGYTDSDGNDEQNLELSQGRALEVLKFALNKTGLNPQKKECLLRLSSTNGRGERNLLPLGTRAGKENKRISRRVEFKIRVKSYEQMKQLELPGKDNG
ncbi:MAG: OmpA family protein [Candidatus Gastranaerophilales bacterium]|nr:OmpA family protein [Candidatus Gastranaerophilales bacterium]